jgi:hypothetical protein
MNYSNVSEKAKEVNGHIIYLPNTTALEKKFPK